jgi:2-C-methyl-D-erythritol 4-phosphate cytidylyltransferase
MEKIAIIVAGGKGSRMKSEVPKQFMLLRKKPVLYYSIKAFIDAFEDIKIILVLPEEYIGKGQEIIDGFFDNTRFRICAGGRTRFHSVKNGLALIEDKESVIFVHDGVRCLVTQKLVERCYKAAVEAGTAIPALTVNDSVRILTDDGNRIVDRTKLRLIQTPQTFHSKILLPAYNIDYKESFTDETSVVEAFGIKINLIEGESNNFKITTLSDFNLAEILLPE